MSETPGVAIRLNPFKGFAGPEGETVPWSPYGRILSSRPAFTLDPLFHAGCYYVQDSSAMYVGHIFRKALSHLPRRRLRVLDLCAAPGGKTTDLAASLRLHCGGDFLLVSNEVMRDRSRILRDNVALWGDPCVMVTSVDPGAFAQFEGFFDIIVADVPCSGEGMFRKDPKAREQFSERTVELCAARQKRILSDVWPSLRSGGVLVYSTCTYQEAENDDNLLWAAENLGGSIITPENEFASYGVKLTRFGNLLIAGEVPGEGQWVGAIIKDAESLPEAGAGQATVALPEPIASQSIEADLSFFEDPLAGALSRLHPLSYGITKGETKGKDFIPDPDYALSISYQGEHPVINMESEEALAYLHHDALSFPEAPLGFNLVAYDGHPLGFVKNLGRRCNSLHPKSRRILMNI